MYQTIAETTISSANKYAYGANIGWLDARADGTNGLSIGEYVCSGYIYSANVGWINVGSGNPSNGIQYQNNASTDFGVNHDGLGNLSGYAYGANIGWIAFEPNGAPKVDLKSGKLSGSIYSANCGWISLSNTVAFVETTSISSGSDSDGDLLPDAWELLKLGTKRTYGATDSDGDGASNYDEYIADTNPDDAADQFRIVEEQVAGGGTLNTLVWNSSLKRFYTIEKQRTLSTNWIDSGLGLISPDGITTSRQVVETNSTSKFYRVGAKLPLTP